MISTDPWVRPCLISALVATRRHGDTTAVAARPHRTEIVPLPRPVTSTALHALLDDLPDDTVRAKGIAEGPDGSRLLIQQVGRRRRIGPSRRQRIRSRPIWW